VEFIEEKKQFYIFEGFEYSFLVLSDTAESCYKGQQVMKDILENGIKLNFSKKD
jgi:dTDP-4-dehydrorhamnose 3,5-epimerase-like enzyme